MQYNLYAIHDAVAGYFMNPFVARNDAEAERILRNAVVDDSNPNNQFAHNPQDFSMFRVGTFCSETGKVTETTPDKLCVGSQFKQKKD